MFSALLTPRPSKLPQPGSTALTSTNAAAQLADHVYGLYIDELVQTRRDLDADGSFEKRSVAGAPVHGEVFFPLHDDMASIYAMTASDGTVIERYDYGDPLYKQGSPIAYDAATGLPIITSVTTSNNQPPSISPSREVQGKSGTRHFFTGRIFEPVAGVSVSSGSTTGGTLAGRGIGACMPRLAMADPRLLKISSFSR